MKHKHIYIFGGTGSGKTTLAEKISKKFKIAAHSTDDFIYKDNYKTKYTEEQRDKKFKEFLKKTKWVIEGVHKSDWILPAVKKADLIILISLPRRILLARVLKREIKNKLQKNTKQSNLKNLMQILKYAYIYKHDNFPHHQRLIKDHKKEAIILKNKKQVKQFLKDLK